MVLVEFVFFIPGFSACGGARSAGAVHAGAHEPIGAIDIAMVQASRCGRRCGSARRALAASRSHMLDARALDRATGRLRRGSAPAQLERDRAEHQGRSDERAGPSGSSSTVAPITAPTSGVT